MVTSRSVPQQIAQIFSPLAGQKRAGLRFSQIGQNTESPHSSRTNDHDTLHGVKRQKAVNDSSRQIDPESEFPQWKMGAERPLNSLHIRGLSTERYCD